MKETINILKKVPNYIFWDMDVTKLNIDRDRDVIISRVLMFSDVSNFNKHIAFLESLYKKETIKSVVATSNERISDEVCSLTSKRYHISITSKFNKYVYL